MSMICLENERGHHQIEQSLPKYTPHPLTHTAQPHSEPTMGRPSLPLAIAKLSGAHLLPASSLLKKTSREAHWARRET